MKCGACLKEFKSYLRLQHHKADVHGEQNQMSRWSKNDLESQRKTNLAAAEEKLKQEISRWRYYNN